jgi:hypothetical protein
VFCDAAPVTLSPASQALYFLLQRAWGSAPLHPRLYAIAALRGLNAKEKLEVITNCDHLARLKFAPPTNHDRSSHSLFTIYDSLLFSYLLFTIHDLLSGRPLPRA